MDEKVNFNADMESCLFYAMMDHKPVGENKHFNMIFVYEKYNNLSDKKLTSDQLWTHLSTLYDMQALNDTEIVPFPNDETEFCLPDNEYATLLNNIQQAKAETRKPSSRQSLASKTKIKLNSANKNTGVEAEDPNEDSDSDLDSKSLQTEKNDITEVKDDIDDIDQTSNSDIVDVSNLSKTDSRKRTNSKRQSLTNKKPIANKPAANKKRKI